MKIRLLDENDNKLTEIKITGIDGIIFEIKLIISLSLILIIMLIVVCITILF